jgi:ribonuclease P protein component
VPKPETPDHVPNHVSNPSPKRRERATFPRSMRLLRHADFERVYKQGKRHFSASLTAFYLRREQEQEQEQGTAPTDAPKAKTNPKTSPQGLRVGFTVGRALGGAVVRNRMKRRLREAVRLSDPPVELKTDVVINPKKSLLAADFEDVLNEVRGAFVVIERSSRSRGTASGPV